MSQGKFSKPRNRFADTPAPVPPQESAPAPETPEELPVPADPIAEEEAMDQAFAQVREEAPEGFFAVFFSQLLQLPKKQKILLITVAAVALAALLAAIGIVALGSTADPYGGRILENVSIAGIDVGGLTRSQAEEVLRSATSGTYTQQDMLLVLPDNTLRFSPAETGAKLDVSSAVKAAYQYGRNGAAPDGRPYIIALLPYLQLNQEYIRSAIEGYAASFGSEYSEPSYEVLGTLPDLGQEAFDPDTAPQVLSITLGTPGLGLDTKEIFERVLDAYSFNTFLVEFQDGPASTEPPVPDLDAIYEDVYIAPVNAAMNNQTFEPIPGSYGRDFDIEEARRLVDMADYGDTVEIEMRWLEPEVQDDNLLFQDVLGYCETPHGANANRTYNLELVCKYLDGVELAPGELFSYNKSVGERTTARGFKYAPAYSGTELVDSVGGGVCQGSSTLYKATLLAEMEIVDRINHGFPTSYIDMGMDATVSWYVQDFQFRNTSSYPIRIKAEVSDGMMKFWIMGTEERSYYIELEYEITRYISPPEYYRNVSADSGYKDGEVIDSGATGYHVKTYKCKYDRVTGELIARDFITLSSYMTKDRIIARVKDSGSTEPSEEPTQPSEPDTQPTEPDKPTDPPATDPPATDPPATDPPATDPPATQPPATEPPATQPPATDPPSGGGDESEE